jgi:hypothetical protein
MVIDEKRICHGVQQHCPRRRKACVTVMNNHKTDDWQRHAAFHYFFQYHIRRLFIYKSISKIYFICEVCEKIGYYCDRLTYWLDNIDKFDREWAGFLLDDSQPNKEKLLNEQYAYRQHRM